MCHSRYELFNNCWLHFSFRRPPCRLNQHVPLIAADVYVPKKPSQQDNSGASSTNDQTGRNYKDWKGWKRKCDRGGDKLETEIEGLRVDYQAPDQKRYFDVPNSLGGSSSRAHNGALRFPPEVPRKSIPNGHAQCQLHLGHFRYPHDGCWHSRHRHHLGEVSTVREKSRALDRFHCTGDFSWDVCAIDDWMSHGQFQRTCRWSRRVSWVASRLDLPTNNSLAFQKFNDIRTTLQCVQLFMLLRPRELRSDLWQRRTVVLLSLPCRL